MSSLPYWACNAGARWCSRKRLSGSARKPNGRIDVFWPGTLLAEHKSAGENPDAAYTQATNYFAGISDDELPRFVVTIAEEPIHQHS